MFPLFLEFLGTTEVLVILIAALVLFGPRKLPELSRSLGKSLNEFKRASEDFKRTWEQEVSADQASHDAQIEQAMLPVDDSIMNAGEERIAAVLSAADATAPTIARSNSTTPYASTTAESPIMTPLENAGASNATTDTPAHSVSDTASGITTSTSDTPSSVVAPQRKRDWL